LNWESPFFFSSQSSFSFVSFQPSLSSFLFFFILSSFLHFFSFLLLSFQDVKGALSFPLMTDFSQLNIKIICNMNQMEF